MRKTLRDTIRNILEDELNKHGIKSNELVDKSRVEESVSIRNDEVSKSNSVDDVLSNAPERAQNFFKVPKVVE